MEAKIETITPDKAKVLLDSSNGNRSLKQAKVAAYARDMTAGNWMLNGGSIVIDWNGALIDGSHRLTACIKSGATFEALVVRGAAPEAQKTIDMGSSRTAADVLGFYGYKNVGLMNTIARILLSLSNGRARSANPSMQEIFTFIEGFPEINDAARFASHEGRAIPKTASAVGAIYALELRAGDVSAVTKFAEVLSSGVPAYAGCAAHALRERLIKDEISKTKITIADRQLLIFSAWEKFKVRAPVKTLKMTSENNLMIFNKAATA